jgi:general secretion pathway protein M
MSRLTLDTIKIYWFNLSERDRRMLTAGGSVVGIYLIYLILFAPLFSAVNTGSQQLIEQQSTLIWMKSKFNSSTQLIKTEKNLLSLFSSQLKTDNLLKFPYQLQQAGAKGIQLSFENVPYVEFMIWLKRLNQQNALTIVELSATRTKTPGVVKLRLIVENQGKTK